MSETLAVLISAMTIAGACGAGACKYYTDTINRPRNTEDVATNTVLEEGKTATPANSPHSSTHSIEDVIMSQIMDRNSLDKSGSDDISIDVQINIHTQHKEKE